MNSYKNSVPIADQITQKFRFYPSFQFHFLKHTHTHLTIELGGKLKQGNTQIANYKIDSWKFHTLNLSFKFVVVCLEENKKIKNKAKLTQTENCTQNQTNKENSAIFFAIIFFFFFLYSITFVQDCANRCALKFDSNFWELGVMTWTETKIHGNKIN